MRVRDIVIVLVSYLVAAILAALVVLWLFVLAERGWDWAGGWDGTLVWPAVYIVLVSAFVPFLLAIGVLRLLGRRGWLAHLLAGVAVSLVAQFVVWFGMRPTLAGLIESWPLLAGGAAAGLAYWAVRSWLAARFASS